MKTVSLRFPSIRLMLFFIAMGCAGCSTLGTTSDRAMKVSVSADGHYAVSSHRGKRLILWNLEDRSHQVVSNDANIYSAYFVKGHDVFLWQDLDDIVHVQNVSGKTIEKFKNFPTYGQLMGPNLKTYVASNENWAIYAGHGENQTAIKPDDDDAFPGFGKLLNLQLAPSGKLLLSSGYSYAFDKDYSLEDERERGHYKRLNGIALWNLNTRKPVQKFVGNNAKTSAALDPNGNDVIAVDENTLGYRWTVPEGDRTMLSQLGSGVYIGGHEPGSPKNRDTSGMHLTEPNDFPGDSSGGSRIAVQFIDENRYLVFFTKKSYVALYKIGDPFARKIFKLGKDPFPSVSDYSRNASIDTAPKAGVLVTGQRSSGGINVYHFDSDDKTLERVWAPTP